MHGGSIPSEASKFFVHVRCPVAWSYDQAKDGCADAGTVAFNGKYVRMRYLAATRVDHGLGETIDLTGVS